MLYIKLINRQRLRQRQRQDMHIELTETINVEDFLSLFIINIIILLSFYYKITIG